MNHTRAEVEASPTLKLSWRNGKLDARCLSCASTMAATSRCYRCGGVLEYREHLPSWSPKRPDLPRVVQWCEQGVTSKPDPSNPRTGIPRKEWQAQTAARKAARKAVQSKVTR